MQNDRKTGAYRENRHRPAARGRSEKFASSGNFNVPASGFHRTIPPSSKVLRAAIFHAQSLPMSVGEPLGMTLETARPSLDSIGNYDLIEKVAEGGMGTVYKGRHRETGQIVAVKVIAPHMVGNQVLLKRFQQEYNASRLLNH